MSFMNLNNACPKYNFPFLGISQLVDSTARHELLTFMDAFLVYNQMLMNEKDQEKTSCITSQGLYCYEFTPFGLKNVENTYQRLVNHMFSK